MTTATFEQRFDAARLTLIRRYRWARRTLMSLKPVERSTGTLSVDRWHRLYFNRAVVDGWSDVEFVGAIWHEVGHILRKHHARLGEYPDRKTANIVADCEINADLREQRITLPPDVFYPEVVGLSEPGYAEQWYRDLKSRQEQPDDGGNESGESDNDESDDYDDGQASNDGDNENESAGDDRRDDGGAPADDDGDSEEDGSDGDSDDGSDDGSEDGTGGQDGSDDDVQTDSSSDDSDSNDGNGGTGNEPYDPTEYDDPGCGSGAGGDDADELPEPSDEEQAEIEREERKQAKETLDEYERSGYSGSLSEGIVNAARGDLQRSVHDWRQTFAVVLRTAMEQATDEAEDYSFRRVSRRAYAAEPGIIPGIFRPIPNVVVIVDGSGSMDAEKVTRATAEVNGILERLAIPRFLAYLWTTREEYRTFVQTRSDVDTLLQHYSGGGTDMHKAIVQAARDGAEVIVVLTDAECPWAVASPVHGVPVIVGGIRRHGRKLPSWVTVVDIADD